MRFKNQKGFAHLEILIVLIVLIAVGTTGWLVFHKDRQKSSNTVNSSSSNSPKTEADVPLMLKSIGFNLDYYNPTTNRAGDMVFTHEDHDLGITHMIFSDFGIQDVRSPN